MHKSVDSFLFWFVFKWAILAPPILSILFTMIVMAKHYIEIESSIDIPLVIECIIYLIYMISVACGYYACIVKSFAKYDELLKSE